jgi:NADPH-dependent 2,4-dienoyl-CoA reductase/sulfur reductase-like enzyme
MTRRRQDRHARILVVGGGRAGVSAAEELRLSGFGGRITVLSAESERPYHRPSCSKGLLTGHARPADVRLPLDGCPDVDWRPGRRAMQLDPDARVVETYTGEMYEYDRLVIATGSYGVAPRDWPIGEPGLHLLHDLRDAWALRRDLRDANRVAIVGAGLTGCETASAVRSLARKCVLVDSNQQVMTRAVGEFVGGLVTDEIRRNGVDLRLGRRVQQIGRRRRGWRLVLDDGSEVDADVVVATTGERPDTGWLATARGLDVTDGVLCDESLRVLGAEGIVAAGAVARWPNLRYDNRPRRCDQWIAAMEHGRAAARALLAGDGPVPPVMPLTRFWSEQFGMRIQVSGELDPQAEIHVTEQRPGRRDIARAGILATCTVDGRLVGVLAVNAPRAFNEVTRTLLTAPQPVPTAARSGSGSGYRSLAAVG